MQLLSLAAEWIVPVTLIQPSTVHSGVN